MSDRPEPYVVVGAGPTAAAAAKALLAGGRQVVVLDTGLALEPEHDAARRRMAAGPPASWSPADVALTRFSASGTSGAGYKRLFGSDVAFRDDGVLELKAGADVGAGRPMPWGASATSGDPGSCPTPRTTCTAGP